MVAVLVKRPAGSMSLIRSRAIGRVAEDHSVYEGQPGVIIIDAPAIATNAALKDRYPGDDHRTSPRTQVKDPVNLVAIDDGLAGPHPGNGQGVRNIQITAGVILSHT